MRTGTIVPFQKSWLAETAKRWFPAHCVPNEQKVARSAGKRWHKSCRNDRKGLADGVEPLSATSTALEFCPCAITLPLTSMAATLPPLGAMTALRQSSSGYD